MDFQLFPTGNRLIRCIWNLVVLGLLYAAMVAGQAINPMMYGMGMYMNPYYTGFYGGFGNMGHMNPLGYQISSGMAIPGMGGQTPGQGGYGQGQGGYGGGGYGFGAGSHLTSSIFVTGCASVFLLATLRRHLL